RDSEVGPAPAPAYGDRQDRRTLRRLAEEARAHLAYTGLWQDVHVINGRADHSRAEGQVQECHRNPRRGPDGARGTTQGMGGKAARGDAAAGHPSVARRLKG